jgi:hypothetical protein
MAKNLIYFIFNVIERITGDDINNSTVSLNHLKEHIKDFSLLLLFLNHNDEVDNTLKKHFNNLIDIHLEIEKLIKNDILYADPDKTKIQINKESAFYSEFANDKTKIFNVLSTIGNTEENYYDDDDDDDDESFCEITKDDNYESQSDNDDDEGSEEDDDSLDGNSQYYIVKSFSTNDNYFVRTDLKKCSCPAFEYCILDTPTCKHIKLLEKCSEEELSVYPKTE